MTIRVTDEVAAQWAQHRADDAGRCAADLLDARAKINEFRDVAMTLRVQLGAAEAANRDLTAPHFPAPIEVEKLAEAIGEAWKGRYLGNMQTVAARVAKAWVEGGK